VRAGRRASPGALDLALEVGAGGVGVERGAPVADGLLGAAAGGLGVAEVLEDHGARAARALGGLGGAGEPAGGLVVLPARVVHPAEGVEDRGVIRGEVRGAAGHAEGLIEPLAARGEGVGEVVEGRRVLGVEGEGLGVCRVGGDGVPAAGVEQPHGGEHGAPLGGGLGRLLRQHLEGLLPEAQGAVVGAGLGVGRERHAEEGVLAGEEEEPLVGGLGGGAGVAGLEVGGGEARPGLGEAGLLGEGGAEHGGSPGKIPGDEPEVAEEESPLRGELAAGIEPFEEVSGSLGGGGVRGGAGDEREGAAEHGLRVGRVAHLREDPLGRRLVAAVAEHLRQREREVRVARVEGEAGLERGAGVARAAEPELEVGELAVEGGVLGGEANERRGSLGGAGRVVEPEVEPEHPRANGPALPDHVEKAGVGRERVGEPAGLLLNAGELAEGVGVARGEVGEAGEGGHGGGGVPGLELERGELAVPLGLGGGGGDGLLGVIARGGGVAECAVDLGERAEHGGLARAHGEDLLEEHARAVVVVEVGAREAADEQLLGAGGERGGVGDDHAARRLPPRGDGEQDSEQEGGEAGHHEGGQQGKLPAGRAHWRQRDPKRPVRGFGRPPGMNERAGGSACPVSRSFPAFPPDPSPMALSRFKAPDTVLVVFAIVVVAALATWFIPPGAFEKEIMLIEGAGEREVVVPGSFQYLDRPDTGIANRVLGTFAAILLAPIQGLTDPDAVPIIAFVLLVGGAFAVLQATGAVDAGLRRLVAAAERSPAFRVGIIPLFMVLFSLGGATFGMAEETIPFVLIFVPLALALGYDSITGVAIPFVGSQAGFAAAFLNPFTVGVAQGIAGVPLFSGIPFRLGLWTVVTGLAVAAVMWHAHRVRRDPQKSPTFELDRDLRAAGLAGAPAPGVAPPAPAEPTLAEPLPLGAAPALTGRQQGVLALFFAGIGLLVWGVLAQGWYIAEIAALFVGLGIAMGAVGGLGANGTARAFQDGARDLVVTALVIGLARGILIVLRDAQAVDPILFWLSSAIGDAGPVTASYVMFGAQTVLNFFVPSGSGQAALTMPLMAPLADLVGVTRQVAVLAFQMGDGFTNLIIPTSAVLMGALTLAKVPWATWARWVLPFQLALFGVGLVALALAVAMGYGDAGVALP